MTGRRWKMFRPFVQDDWRVTHDLTLNSGRGLGTRDARSPKPTTDRRTLTGRRKQYLIAGNAPFSGCTNCVRTDSNVGVNFDKTAIEPRIGLAWKPFGLSENRGSCWLLHLPRFGLEPGRAGTLAESALLRRGRPVQLRLPGRCVPVRQRLRWRSCGKLRSKVWLLAVRIFSHSPRPRTRTPLLALRSRKTRISSKEWCSSST